MGRQFAAPLLWGMQDKAQHFECKSPKYYALEEGGRCEIYHKNACDPAKAWKRVKELYADDCTKNHKGVFEQTRRQNTSLLKSLPVASNFGGQWKEKGWNRDRDKGQGAIEQVSSM